MSSIAEDKPGVNPGSQLAQAEITPAEGTGIMPTSDSDNAINNGPSTLEGTARRREEQEGEEGETAGTAAAAALNGHIDSIRDDDVQDGDGDELAEEEETEETDAAAARISALEGELDRVTEDKNKLEAQYRNLLGKLTSMRNTLGDKLAADAEELDRREATIAELQAHNDDLAETVDTLKAELIASNDEAERLHGTVEQLRARADDSAKASVEESSVRESQLRDLVEDLERVRLEREDWENQALKERVERETLETSLNAAERELATLRHEKQLLKDERDREAESAANLHTVLEEFQAAKDRELRTTLGDLQTQLQTTARSMQEYKQRAQAAEAKLHESNSDSERCTALQKEVKEKNIFIGKLRHEAVILNEHLTEALRRLKKDTSENNVDRRLVTNVLITFFNTPRADSKRFEMLSLLASILSWGDDDRERAGLQRIGGTAATNGAGPSSSKPNISLGSSRRRAMSRATSAFAGSKAAAGAGPDESFSAEGLEQSFSNLWVEYLLREAQGGSPPPSSSLPPMPSLSSPPLASAGHKSISPFAELARPSSPTKSASSNSIAGAPAAGRYSAAPLSRQRSGTDTSESASLFSRTGTAEGPGSTAPTSVASGSGT